MKKNNGLILMALLLNIFIFSVTGCMKFRVNLSLNKDGSGNIEYILATPPSIYKLITENPQELKKIKDAAKEAGYSISSFKSSDYLGLRLKQNFNNITKIKNSVILLKAFEDNDDNKSLSNKLSAPKIAIKKSFFRIYYTYKQEIDLSNYTLNQDNPLITKIDSSLLNKIDLRMKLTLPAKVLEHNADLIDDRGRTLVWNFILGKKKEIYLKVAVLNTINVMSTGIASLITLFIGVLVFIRKIRVK
jgi:hypothetical protein